MTSDNEANLRLSILAKVGAEPIQEQAQGVRPLHVDFVRLDGMRYGFSYAHLLWIVCTPKGRVVLHFSSHTILLRGRNLKALYWEFLNNSVVRVTCTRKDRDDGEGDAPVVHSLHVVQKPEPVDFDMDENIPESND